ncbi:SsgA family sporulation/cell division regulator [Kitasatospora sp. CMC57]|uniref:SsgA family sporulation/cell division regulator n=1 Tax=Kitasatospora sp. CMC57 TaxID=3231513 RepID=A0AB33JUC8_9ACTN
MQEVIAHGVPALMVGLEPPRIEVCLEYRPDDPYAVSMLVGAPGALGGCPVGWVFARQLLVDGVTASAGLGNVRVRPYDPEQTAVELRVGGDLTVLLVRTSAVRRFLAATYQAVAPGAEWRRIGWEEVLARLTEDRP